MCNKKNLLLTTFALFGVALLIITQTAGTSGNQQVNKLEGAWASTMPGSPVLASFVLAPADPSGRRAAMSGKVAVGISVAAYFPDVEPSSLFVGEAVVTGPDTTSYTIIGYMTKKVVPTPTSPFDSVLLGMWVDSGQFTNTAPGKAEGVHHIAYYRPEADTNGDGIPEGAPLFCVEGPGVNTRVTLMTPCKP